MYSLNLFENVCGFLQTHLDVFKTKFSASIAFRKNLLETEILQLNHHPTLQLCLGYSLSHLVVVH
jgi:hypothetical protein